MSHWTSTGRHFGADYESHDLEVFVKTNWFLIENIDKNKVRGHLKTLQQVKNRSRCSHVHEVVDFLAGASEPQRRRARREALSVAAVEHVGPVILQEVQQQPVSSQLAADRRPPPQRNPAEETLQCSSICFMDFLFCFVHFLKEQFNISDNKLSREVDSTVVFVQEVKIQIPAFLTLVN